MNIFLPFVLLAASKSGESEPPSNGMVWSKIVFCPYLERMDSARCVEELLK